jgi:hypothetical protein
MWTSRLKSANILPMPLCYSFSSTERLVVVTAKGSILPEDVMTFLARVDSEGAQRHGKLFDVTELTTVFSDDRVRQLAETVQHRVGPAGPIAIVARDEHSLRQARLFVGVVGDARKVVVFEEQEVARNWLKEQGSNKRS